jgi:hypothetical protein
MRGTYEERAAAAGTAAGTAALVREDTRTGACAGAGARPGKAAAPPPAPDREDPTTADISAEDAADADADAADDPDRSAKGSYVKGAFARCDAAVGAAAAAAALVREDADAGTCAGAGVRPAEVVALPPAPDREGPAAADISAEDAAAAVEDCAPANPRLVISPHTY